MKKMILVLFILLALPLAGMTADEPEYVPVLDGQTYYTEGWSVYFAPQNVVPSNSAEPAEQGWAIVQYGASSAVAIYRYYPPLLVVDGLYFVYSEGMIWSTNGFFMVRK